MRALATVDSSFDGAKMCVSGRLSVMTTNNRPNRDSLNFFTPKIITRASWSSCAHLASALVSVRDAHAIDYLVPLGYLCDNTTEIPTGLATHATVIGNLGLYCSSTSFDFNASLIFKKHSLRIPLTISNPCLL